MIHTYSKKLTNLFIILVISNLFGCSSKVYNDKEHFKRLSSSKSNLQEKISPMRNELLRETALSLGARGGLAKRAKVINLHLVKLEDSLTRAFNFYGMMLDDNVLPPILVEARNTLNLASNSSIRIARRDYEIIHQARFVTAPPHWRDYLWLDYSKPEEPDRSLLPRNDAEKIVWKTYIEEGWQAGISQADSIFRENVNRLIRDYEGMIRYRKLLAQNMVSLPYVASLDLGITGNSEKMAIDDKVLKITAFPAFQTHGQNWKTEITKHD